MYPPSRPPRHPAADEPPPIPLTKPDRPGIGCGAPERLRAQITRVGAGVTVLSLDGPVDLATADVFATALTDIVTAARDGDRIVLELDRVTFLAAHGLGIIAAAHDRARRGGAAVVLVADQVGPAAVTLRFLTDGQCPVTHRTLTDAITVPDPS